MINNDQSTLLLYCCKDVKSHRSGGDTVPLMFVVFTQISRQTQTPFTRDRIRVVATSSSVSLRSYLLLPLFLWYALIKFCNIIKNLRVMFVLRLFKLIWYHTDPVPCERGLRLTPQTSFYPEYIPLRQNTQPDCFFLVASLLKVSAKDLCVALTTSSNVTRGNVSSMLSTWQSIWSIR